MGYCQPWNAGLASSTRSVCRRLGRLLTAMGMEITSDLVTGDIVEDIRAARRQLLERLEAEGWTMSYDGGSKLKVRQPGHKKPFKRMYA